MRTHFNYPRHLLRVHVYSLVFSFDRDPRYLSRFVSGMMTSSNGNIFRVTGNLCGEFTGFPAQRPVTRSFDVFSELRLNKRLSKQSWGWWFETLSCSLWRQRNGIQSGEWIPEIPGSNPGPRFNIKTIFPGIEIEMVMRQSYLYGNSYTDKTASLYWDGSWGSPHYRDSHVKDKTISRPSYF